VHRAISPSNVLLGRTGAVLAEPGVAHLVLQGRTIAGLGQGAGGVSLELVDPRVMRGEPAGRASDIWSLGVTLHLALAGCGLFPALVSADPLLAVRIYLRSRPEPDESLSEAERAAVVRAVQPDPAQRYRTAAELADDVERVAMRSRVGAP
jgi:eukaryotic-like serine/threonine-protein kinase